MQGPSLRVEALRLALAEVEGGPQPELQVDIADELITACATAQSACVGLGIVVGIASPRSRWATESALATHCMKLYKCEYRTAPHNRSCQLPTLDPGERVSG